MALTLMGIDYSMSCPAICVHVGDEWNLNNCRFYYATASEKFQVKKKLSTGMTVIGGALPSEWKSNIWRYDRISKWAMTVINGSMPENEDDDTFIFLEGYAMGAKGQVFNIAENTGILKYKLHLQGIDANIRAPTEVKKFALKGNASKKDLYAQFLLETNIDLKKLLDETFKAESPSGDIVDSYYVCKYGHSIITTGKMLTETEE